MRERETADTTKKGRNSKRSRLPGSKQVPTISHQAADKSQAEGPVIEKMPLSASLQLLACCHCALKTDCPAPVQYVFCNEEWIGPSYRYWIAAVVPIVGEEVFEPVGSKFLVSFPSLLVHSSLRPGQSERGQERTRK